jgi:hypothetical protein
MFVEIFKWDTVLCEEKYILRISTSRPKHEWSIL